MSLAQRISISVATATTSTMLVLRQVHVDSASGYPIDRVARVLVEVSQVRDLDQANA